MHRLKRRFVLLVVPASLILFASLVVAQGPPGCANACWQAYTDAVRSCHGDTTCLANARAAARACVKGCNLSPKGP
jgi:hypothetical protein